jgi:glycolate oxidase FAD binding subunit
MTGVHHIPSDMTATADANLTLAALQSELSRGGQWLPLDPAFPDHVTLAQILTDNLSGPRRFGYGSIRDYTLGLKAQLADGRMIKMGGQVVKNVAGYDLQKLFIGSHQTLGKILEATFKLRPLPERQMLLHQSCATLPLAGAAIEAVLESALMPVILDLHNVKTNFTVALAFDGTVEEVDWQCGVATKMGFAPVKAFDYEATFWAAKTMPVQKLSVLPSSLINALAGIGKTPFVARAGNGIVYHRGPGQPRPAHLPVQLWERTKAAFDPNHLFPSLPA